MAVVSPPEHIQYQEAPSPYRECLDSVVSTVAETISQIWNTIYYSMIVELAVTFYKIIYVRADENPEGWTIVKNRWNDANNEASAYTFQDFWPTVLRDFIQDPVEDISAPEIGMDPWMNPQHLSAPVYVEPEIPAAPDEEIAQLLPLFDRFVTRDHPDLIDDDTPGTFEQYRAGIETLVRKLQEERFQYRLTNSRALDVLKHICHLLNQENPDITDRMKAACLIELAKGGHRECPTRIMEGSLRFYQTLSGNLQVLTLPQQIGKILHDARLGIFREKSRLHGHPEDVQVYQEYIISLRDYLGISHAIPTYNDHLILSFDLTPKKSLPDFFQTYTSPFIIDLVTNAINGLPIAGRPDHERAAKQIPTDRVYEWFVENPLPAGVVLMDLDTNTFTEEAILHLVNQLGILQDQ